MGKGHVLIVDHEESLVASLLGLLREAGFTVSYARDGHQALSLIQTETPDLVLLDIWLPGMDGMETLRTLHRLHTGIKVVMISGHGNIETAVKATHLGALDYLEKPCAPEVVLQTIHRVLQTHPSETYRDYPAVPADASLRDLIGESPQMERLRRQVAHAMSCDSPVLICGEAGSDTAVVAHLLHDGGQRREGALEICRCDGLSSQVAEHLLFGAIPHRRNGPLPPMRGYLERANGGTVFLHRLERLPPQIQEKLAHTMTTCTLQRVGGTVPIPINIRYLASRLTLPEPRSEPDPLSPGLGAQFEGLIIDLPPLRQRKSDIPALVRHVLRGLTPGSTVSPWEIDKTAMALLQHHDWPGNDAELKQLLRLLTRNTAPKRLRERDVLQAMQHVRLQTAEPRTGVPRAYPPAPHRKPHVRQYLKQRTLQRSVVLYGQGLQSGLKTGIILSPLPPNSGIVFCKITTGERLPASVEHVISTEFCTSLRHEGVTARTVEHLMSALHAYRITNLLIKITDEVPILDGSAVEFCDCLDTGGLEDQDSLAEEFVVDRCYHVGDENPEAKSIAVEPYNGFRVTYRLAYPEPLGVQEFAYEHRDAAGYRREVAPARTFGFVKDVENLHELGMVAGGRLNNVILLDGEKIVNSTELRFPNEFARHKVLDIIGDLYLLGQPLRGHVRANMTGHTENVALVRQLYAAMSRSA